MPRRNLTIVLTAVGYVAAIALIGSFSTAIWLSSKHLIAAQIESAAEVNIAGRQRMLSQRIAFLSVRLSDPSAQRPADLRDEIVACADMMERATTALLTRDRSVIEASIAEGVVCRPGPSPQAGVGQFPPALRTLLFQDDDSVVALVARFSNLARQVATLPMEDPAWRSALERLVPLSQDELVAALDHMTFLLQRDGQDRLQRLARRENIAWASTLALLLLEALLIFLPLYRRVRSTLRELEEKIDELEEREQARLELQSSLVRSRNFLSHMSHELRTPLNAICGFTEVLTHMRESQDGSSKTDQYIDYIGSAATHLSDLVDNILDLARIEAGRQDLTLTEVGLDALIDETIGLVAPAAGKSRITLRRDQPPVALTLRADARALRQILLNVLSNAVKYNSDGGEVRIAAAENLGGMVCITVADSGAGMSQSDVDAAFEPFHRGERVPEIAVGGTGLGLPITRKLVELHGGKIRLRSRPDHGTVVEIELPKKGPGKEAA